MNKSKRKFLKNGLTLGLGLPLLGTSVLSCNSQETKLNILILGGTSFLGPHQIAYAISRGHSVTTFTRGKTKPTIYTELFDQVEMLIGDRVDNLTALENRKWDVVIDNSGRASDWTQRTAELLKDNVGLYLYISSTGVFYPYLEADLKEGGKIPLEDPIDPDYEGPAKRDSYGVMKAKSELETIKAFGEDRSIIVRPSFMVGPADLTDRFIHWPVRMAKGGDVMVPGKTDDPVQYIDVRDIAEWCIRLAEEKTTGTFNALGPSNVQTMAEFAIKAKDAFDIDTNLIQIDDYDFLKSNRVSFIIPWILPDGDYYGSARINGNKAFQAGLTTRPLKETMNDTYDWWKSDALTQERREEFELNPRSVLVREKDVLEKWKVYKK
jgi:nucleoside-diphosphate-sugar epimerase